MRVLVTGAGGLLGGRLAELLAGRHAVVAGWHEAPPPAGLPSVQLDIDSAESLRDALDTARPDAMVHCAALAHADRCEREPERAERLNAEAPRRLAQLCRARGLRLLALSTDLVLDGEHAPAREQDPARPVLAYGRTKLAGEQAVLAEYPEAAVLRVALVLGRGRGERATASEAIAWSLATGQRVRLFRDQFRTPLDPESLAVAVEALLARNDFGRFHLGGPERVSRLELGLRVARLLGLREALIEAVPQEQHHPGVPRPRDVSLDCSRARTELGWRPRPLDAAIRESRRAPV